MVSIRQAPTGFIDYSSVDRARTKRISLKTTMTSDLQTQLLQVGLNATVFASAAGICAQQQESDLSNPKVPLVSVVGSGGILNDLIQPRSGVRT